MFAALAATIGLIAALPRHSPLVGIVVIVMNTTLIGASFLPFRADEWHRRRGLQAVGVGFAGAVLWLVVEALRAALEDGHRMNPGRGLAAAGAAWLIADIFLRQSEPDSAGEES